MRDTFIRGFVIGLATGSALVLISVQLYREISGLSRSNVPAAVDFRGYEARFQVQYDSLLEVCMDIAARKGSSQDLLDHVSPERRHSPTEPGYDVKTRTGF